MTASRETAARPRGRPAGPATRHCRAHASRSLLGPSELGAAQGHAGQQQPENNAEHDIDDIHGTPSFAGSDRRKGDVRKSSRNGTSTKKKYKDAAAGSPSRGWHAAEVYASPRPHPRR